MLDKSIDAREIQAWMINRFAREMSVSPAEVDPHAPLAKFPFDSLAYVGLAAELAELVQQDLSAEIIWEYDTIAALADYLGGQANSWQEAECCDHNGAMDKSSGHFESNGRTGTATNSSTAGELPARQTLVDNPCYSGVNRWTPLRVIQPNGDRIPLFLVHGIAGGVGQYQAIGNELGPNQPVYGLRQSMEFDESIESMAASLLDSIRTVQRHGPYCLGGYCFGGVVAFEIARQLEMAGEEPGLLVMFDSPLPLRRRLTVLDNGARNGSFLSALVTGGNGAGGAPVPSRREMAGRMTQKLRSWFNTVFGKGDRKPRADRFFETYYSKTEQETVRKNIALLRSWTPGNWGGRIVFFQSAEHRVFESVAPRVWRQFAGKGVEVVPVAARHNELLAKENLQPVVQALRSELDCVSEN